MDIRKLQRLIVDALQDVKALDIQVFNTEALTSLFDRVIVAGGSSNRQTRALAASVRDKVRAAGGTVKNAEGAESGEWVLVDCGDAVVHIMQPAIRAYYKLEDLWGGKSVHLKPNQPVAPAAKTPAKAAAKASAKAPARAPAKASTRAPAKAPARTSTAPATKASAVKPVTKAAPKPASKPPARRVAKTAAKVSAPRRAS